VTMSNHEQLSKEQFLQQVRKAVRSCPRNGASPAPADPSEARLVQCGVDEAQLLRTFAARLESSGGKVHFRPQQDVVKLIGQLLGQEGQALVLVDQPAVLRRRLGFDLAEHLSRQDLSVQAADVGDADSLFAAYAAVTPVELAIAETGSLLVAGGEGRCPLASLTSEVHVALIWPDQLVADLLDAMERIGRQGDNELGRGMTLITGPSKTADIEMNLVVGVHGPEALHAVVICPPPR